MFRYGQGSEIIEITIRDNSGGKIETWKFKVNDPRAKQVLNSIIHKYGLEKKPNKDRDLDWLK
jgi:hypothetical protein